MISSLGKILLIVGLTLAVIGLLMLFSDRLGFLRALWERFPLGRLPGDIVIRKNGVSFYFPWVTCLVVSIVLTLVAWLFRK